MKTLMYCLFFCFISSTLVAQNSISPQQRAQLNQINFNYEQKLKRNLSKADQQTLQLMQREAVKISNFQNLYQRKRAIAQFNQKYGKFRQNLLAKSSINEPQYLQQIKNTLPQFTFQQKGKSLVALKKSNTPNYSKKINLKRGSYRPATPKGRAVPTRNTNYTPPPSGAATTSFAATFEEIGCGGDYNGEYDSDQFSTFSSAALINGCENTRALGSNFNIPAGVKRVRVKVTLNEGYLLSSVAFGMAGYGQNYNEIGIMVHGGGQTQFHKDAELLAIAPVAYMADIDSKMDGTYIMESSFVPVSSGGTYRIKAYGKSFSLGIAGGMGVGYSQIKGLSEIEVSYEY
jgi:hypothetical protein